MEGNWKVKHMNDKIQLGREEIICLLQDLGDRLLEKGVYAQMYIYGGAVICAEYQLRETTFDIDCIYTDDNIRQQAEIIAKKRNIQQDWLNYAVAEIVFEDMYRQDKPIREVRFGALTISIPTARQLLAMKLFSARLGISNDLDDAYKLAVSLEIKTQYQLRSLLLEYFKKESVIKRNKYEKNVIGRFINTLVERLSKL